MNDRTLLHIVLVIAALSLVSNGLVLNETRSADSTTAPDAPPANTAPDNSAVLAPVKGSLPSAVYVHIQGIKGTAKYFFDHPYRTTRTSTTSGNWIAAAAVDLSLAPPELSSPDAGPSVSVDLTGLMFEGTIGLHTQGSTMLTTGVSGTTHTTTSGSSSNGGWDGTYKFNEVPEESTGTGTIKGTITRVAPAPTKKPEPTPPPCPMAFGPLTITKLSDSTTLPLYELAGAGKTIERMYINVVSAKDPEQLLMSYVLGDVVISSVSTTNRPLLLHPMDTLVLDFDRLELFTCPDIDVRGSLTGSPMVKMDPSMDEESSIDIDEAPANVKGLCRTGEPTRLFWERPRDCLS